MNRKRDKLEVELYLDRLSGGEGHIDWDFLSSLLQMDEGDDREGSEMIMQSFHGDFEACYRELEGSIQKKDLNEIANYAHRLKGITAYIGLTMLKDLCEEIQMTAREGDRKPEEALRKIEQAFAKLQPEYENVTRVLNQFFEDRWTQREDGEWRKEGDRTGEGRFGEW